MSNPKFSNFMHNQLKMVQGDSALMLSEHADLEAVTQAIEEQQDGLSSILAEMSKEGLSDIKGGLEEAIKGFLVAGKSLKTISNIGKIMAEGSDHELAKLGFAISKIEETYEVIGRLLKATTESVKEASKSQV